MSEHHDHLQALLGPEAADLAALTVAEAETLSLLLTTARSEQRAELLAGLDAALAALPRLVRGPARTIVFGGSR